MFTTLPIRSATEPWDQWADVSGPAVGEQDGTVNLRDIQYLIFKFNTHGPPYVDRALINATQSQIDGLNLRIDELNSSLNDLRSEVEGMNVTNLMPLIDSLNTSLTALSSDVANMNSTLMCEISVLNANVTALSSRISSLETQIDIMNATIAGMNTIITQLQNSNADLNNRVNALEGNVSLILGRLNALEANCLKAIPSNSSYATSYAATSDSYNWGDMAAMSVTLTVNRTSNLMILFSTDAYCSVGPAETSHIYIQAMANSTVAAPSYVTLTPCVQVTGFSFLPSHSHYLSEGAYSYTFNMPSITPGFYTIKIQWRVTYGSPQGTGYAGYRTLTAIALPT